MKPLSIIQGTVATLANWPREKNSTGTEAWVSRPGNHPAGNPVDVDERLVTTDPHMQALLATALTSGGRVLVKARSVDVDGQHAYFDPESIVIWHPSVAEE